MSCGRCKRDEPLGFSGFWGTSVDPFGGLLSPSKAVEVYEAYISAYNGSLRSRDHFFFERRGVYDSVMESDTGAFRRDIAWRRVIDEDCIVDCSSAGFAGFGDDKPIRNCVDGSYGSDQQVAIVSDRANTDNGGGRRKSIGTEGDFSNGCRGGVSSADGRTVSSPRVMEEGQVVSNSVRTVGPIKLSDDQLGLNTLRNRRWRQEKKEKKKRKQVRDASSNVRLDQINEKKNWRDGDAVGGDKGYLPDVRDVGKLKGSKGFWNSCSDEIRQQLIDSKAQMHIAENRRKKVAADLKYNQDQAALSAANSVPMLVSQMVAVSRLANQLVRTTKDDQVHGWAKTVADSLTKSVAESAISKSDSLPSLESVGYGDSALKSSDGDSVKSRRLLLYQAKVEEFDRLVEEDSFDTVNQEVAYKKRLDDEYADVLLSEREFFEKKMTDSVINYYMSNGKGIQEIELAIAGMGLPPRDLHAEFYSEI